MNIETFRNYCLSKKLVTENFPFDEVTLVFKVSEKMFALAGLESKPTTVNLKCDPTRAIELREMHPEINPGYHMSKIHWNTVNIEGNLSNEFIQTLIDDSYNLVVAGISKKKRQALGLDR
ncbi:MAG: MmcQ-like protein [Bacteroidetes bacterium HGW-Bacteroidetes-13]|jgi:predicted DNA-binding protein (MmcQ/YjbR family)|nr:MAG: MmcQ-like protein [Bacteroidetes bacterium HGW-Bacteroidetes-13]